MILLIANHLSNPQKSSESIVAPDPMPVERLHSAFEDTIECSVVDIHTARSKETDRMLLVWTDGMGTRVNRTVNLYIDTTDVVQWKEDTAITVTIDCKTIRKGFTNERVTI